jgi:hypothetical protein
MNVGELRERLAGLKKEIKVVIEFEEGDADVLDTLLVDDENGEPVLTLIVDIEEGDEADEEPEED